MAARRCGPQSQRRLNSASPVTHSECTRASSGSSPLISPMVSTTCSFSVSSSAKPCILNMPHDVGNLEASIKRMATHNLFIESGHNRKRRVMPELLLQPAKQQNV